MSAVEPKVIIVARDGTGKVLRRLELSWLEWYDGEPNLIDDTEEQRKLGVRTLEGQQVNAAGCITREWRYLLDEQARVVDEDTWEEGDPPREHASL
jgi:hypothetical protein